MISKEQHEEFLNTIDTSIKRLVAQEILDDSKGNIEYCSQVFFTKRYGSKPEQIVWVKQGNSPIIEFYPSELTLPWLVTYMGYYNSFMVGDVDTDIRDTYEACSYLAFVLTKVKGINIVDGVVYLLENDLEFVQYKLDQKLFI